MREHPSRRQVCAGIVGLGVGLLAGCAGANDDGTVTDNAAGSGPDTKTAADSTDTAADSTDTETGASATADTPLDLREANVVGIAVEPDGDAYDFDVTLHHDDDGEDGYANWWQVERLDGTRLGRRELLHAHSQQPFTRSATVEITAETECVVVRGHDRTHGYGGRAVAVDLASGTSHGIDQGPERRPIEPGECPTG